MNDTDRVAGAVVLRLQRRKPGMRDMLASQMLDYWTGLRAGRPVPCRSEVDPRRIEALLPHALMLEHVTDGPPRIRLAGTQPCALMGMDLRGMPLTAMLEPGARDRFAALAGGVFDGPAVLDCDLATGDDGLPLRARLLMLPLTSDKGAVTRALACLAAEGVIGLPPRRFGLLDARLSPVGTAAPGLAEPATGFVPAPPRGPAAGGGHLRLVKG